MAVRFLDRIELAPRAALVERMATHTYKASEILISHQDQGSDIYFLLSGTAQVTIFSVEGKAVAYRRIEAGDVVGELAAIDSIPRSATVTALSEVVAGALSQAKFRHMVETEPAFTWALLGHLSQQSREMTERIFEFSTMLVRDRLIAELVRLGREAGVDDGIAEIIPAPTHFDLATKISTHREAVSREMSDLAKNQLLTRTPRSLILHDVDELAALIRKNRPVSAG